MPGEHVYVTDVELLSCSSNLSSDPKRQPLVAVAHVMFRNNGALVSDPPLSALGHQQARETAEYLEKLVKGQSCDANDNDGDSCAAGHAIDKILVSPYLRVIQTAAPTSDLLGLPLNIETGLSEAHATPGGLPPAEQRYPYFPQLNTDYEPMVQVRSTPGHVCPKTSLPCEAFPSSYVHRLRDFASHLEHHYYGRNVVLFSHAASVALVCALARCTLRGLKFAPCGVFHLERKNDGPWRVMKSGASNAEYVSRNVSTTYPWGFQDKHFDKVENMDLDFFDQSSDL